MPYFKWEPGVLVDPCPEHLSLQEAESRVIQAAKAYLGYLSSEPYLTRGLVESAKPVRDALENLGRRHCLNRRWYPDSHIIAAVMAFDKNASLDTINRMSKAIELLPSQLEEETMSKEEQRSGKAEEVLDLEKGQDDNAYVGETTAVNQGTTQTTRGGGAYVNYVGPFTLETTLGAPRGEHARWTWEVTVTIEGKHLTSTGGYATHEGAVAFAARHVVMLVNDVWECLKPHEGEEQRVADPNQMKPGVDITPVTKAAQFLESALRHMRDREKTYDSPGGERSMARTIEMFNIATGKSLTEEDGWLIMVLLKVSRLNQGAFRSDNYEDGAAYIGLLGEAAARRAQKEKEGT